MTVDSQLSEEYSEARNAIKKKARQINISKIAADQLGKPEVELEFMLGKMRSDLEELKKAKRKIGETICLLYKPFPMG